MFSATSYPASVLSHCHSLAISRKAVAASNAVGSLKGDVPDVKSPYSICISTTGLPVKVTTVFPAEPAEAVKLGVEVVLALLAPEVPWLLQDDVGHSARGLIGLVMDLTIWAPPFVLIM
jgi:hypothetical protein